MNISDVTNGYELHYWEALDLASGRGATYTHVGEINILSNNSGTTNITSFPGDANYTIVDTFENQMAWSYGKGNEHYILKLDKEYTVRLRVTGDFKPMSWWFKFTPTCNGNIISH